MTDEFPQKPKKRYPVGSPYICRRGNAIFFYIGGQPWVIGIPRVLNMIRGKSKIHYLNPPPREVEKGITIEEKISKISSYKGNSTLSGKILEEAGYGQHTAKE